MSSKEDLDVRFSFLTCPFFQTCSLPKIPFLCKVPQCKNCPDYSLKLNQIKF